MKNKLYHFAFKSIENAHLFPSTGAGLFSTEEGWFVAENLEYTTAGILKGESSDWFNFLNALKGLSPEIRSENGMIYDA